MELTEQEQLARLVSDDGGLDKEPLDSAHMLTQGLMKRIGGVDGRMLNQVRSEIEASGNTTDHSPVSRFSSDDNSTATPVQQIDPNLVITLKNIHAGLVDVFERSGMNSGFEDKLVTMIGKTGSCIRYLGDEVDEFQPLSHLSGLEAPDMVKNANKVVDTTLQCYKLGKIDDTSISDDGRTIGIIFSGTEHGVNYKACGTITATSWEGSEAIDYIYVPSSGGKMSIKTFENGKWIDKSESEHYDIFWELLENDVVVEGNDTKEENKSSNEKSVIVESDDQVGKNISQKEEEQPEPLNNEDDDEEI